MSPAQHAALEALAGRALSAAEVALATDRADSELAASLSAGRSAVAAHWLTDRGLVAALVMATGSVALSDSILTKLDAAATASRSVRALANRLYNDAQGLDFGDPALRAWIAAETPALFTEAERDALLALAVQPAPLAVDTVSNLLNREA